MYAYIPPTLRQCVQYKMLRKKKSGWKKERLRWVVLIFVFFFILFSFSTCCLLLSTFFLSFFSKCVHLSKTLWFWCSYIWLLSFFLCTYISNIPMRFVSSRKKEELVFVLNIKENKKNEIKGGKLNKLQVLKKTGSFFSFNDCLFFLAIRTVVGGLIRLCSYIGIVLYTTYIQTFSIVLLSYPH